MGLFAMNNNYYTPKEVGKMLRLSTIRILQLVNAGDLQAYRLGAKTIRISSVALEDYLQKKKINTPSLK
jgi:excisionase family DNA binding protein|tara:strand:- start:1118 stop:1324 length:207 start_codon:yes stop_codon:yes gene_type:complete